MVLAAGMLWGTTGTAQAFAPAGATPLAVGAVRLAIGGAALLVLAVARRKLRPSGWPWRPTLLLVATIALYQVCFFAAVARTGVAVGTVVRVGVRLGVKVNVGSGVLLGVSVRVGVRVLVGVGAVMMNVSTMRLALRRGSLSCAMISRV